MNPTWHGFKFAMAQASVELDKYSRRLDNADDDTLIDVLGDIIAVADAMSTEAKTWRGILHEREMHGQ